MEAEIWQPPKGMVIKREYVPGLETVESDSSIIMRRGLFGIVSRTPYFRTLLGEKDGWLRDGPEVRRSNIPELIKEGPIEMLAMRATMDTFENDKLPKNLEEGFYTRALKERLLRGPRLKEKESVKDAIDRFVRDFSGMVAELTDLGQGGAMLLSKIGNDPDLAQLLDFLALLSYSGYHPSGNDKFDLVASLGIFDMLSWKMGLQVTGKENTKEIKEMFSELLKSLDGSTSDNGKTNQKWGDIPVGELRLLLFAEVRDKKKGKRKKKSPKGSRDIDMLIKSKIRAEVLGFTRLGSAMKSDEKSQTPLSILRDTARRDVNKLIQSKQRPWEFQGVNRSDFLYIDRPIQVDREKGQNKTMTIPLTPIMRKYYESSIRWRYQEATEGNPWAKERVLDSAYLPDGRMMWHAESRKAGYKTPKETDSRVREIKRIVGKIRDGDIEASFPLQIEQIITIVKAIPDIPVVYQYNSESRIIEKENPEFLEILGVLREEFQREFVAIGPTPVTVEAIPKHASLGLDGITFRSANETLPSHKGDIEVVFEFIGGTKVYGIFSKDGTIRLPMEYNLVVRAKLELMALAYLGTLRDRNMNVLVRNSSESELGESLEGALVDESQATADLISEGIGETNDHFMGPTLRSNAIWEVPHLDTVVEREGHPDHGKTQDAVVEAYYGFSLSRLNAELLRCMLDSNYLDRLQKENPSLGAKLEVILGRIKNKRLTISGRSYRAEFTSMGHSDDVKRMMLVEEREDGKAFNPYQLESGELGEVAEAIEKMQETGWKPGEPLSKGLIQIAGKVAEGLTPEIRFRMYLDYLVEKGALLLQERDAIIDKGVPPFSISFKSEAWYNKAITVQVDEEGVKRRLEGKTQVT